MAFVTSSGRRLAPASILGKGAEGTIYNVQGDGAIAVKIYTDGNGLGRLPKLSAMIADRLHQRTPFVAFPIETVTANGNFAGFTMRKVASSRPLFQLCITSDRKSEFPDANFRFMVHVALNLAKAVASLNTLGAVVGDLNESGALVSQKQGIVTLVDSDSIQYSSGGRIYRCTKGKAEYTPPELQGRPFNAVDRMINHDAFGLAVLLFEILFLGRHPFSGVPRTSNHPTIAEAIQSGRFAYSPHKTRTLMDPPQHMPVLTDIPADVAMAFQRAFGPHSGNATTARPPLRNGFPYFKGWKRISSSASSTQRTIILAPPRRVPGAVSKPATARSYLLATSPSRAAPLIWSTSFLGLMESPAQARLLTWPQ
jgi:DNA-binding helix-hairpin-helix protein with protein kinase domain